MADARMDVQKPPEAVQEIEIDGVIFEMHSIFAGNEPLSEIIKHRIIHETGHDGSII